MCSFNYLFFGALGNSREGFVSRRTPPTAPWTRNWIPFATVTPRLPPLPPPKNPSNRRFAPLLLLRRNQPDQDPIPTLHRQSTLLHKGHLRIPIHDIPIRPYQLYKHIRSLRQRELLAGTYPWPCGERDVVPARLEALPSLRTESLGVVAPDVRVAVHSAEVEGDLGALGHADGCCSGGPAARGKDGVPQAQAEVAVSGGDETET